MRGGRVTRKVMRGTGRERERGRYGMNEYERKREEMLSEPSHHRLLINHRVVSITELPELILLI